MKVLCENKDKQLNEAIQNAVEIVNLFEKCETLNNQNSQ